MSTLSQTLDIKSVGIFGLGCGTGIGAALVLKKPLKKIFIFGKVLTSKKLTAKLKMVLVVRDDVSIDRGKIACHCATAAISSAAAVRQHNMELSRAWIFQGMPKIVLRANASNEEGLYELSKKAKKLGVISALIKNNSSETQCATVLCLGPAEEANIDSVTGHLKLL